MNMLNISELQEFIELMMVHVRKTM